MEGTTTTTSNNSEAMVLIYQAGMPEAGKRVSLAEVEAGLASGHLSRYDLIWDNGIWKPFDAVFELPASVGLESGMDKSASDLALHLDELPSILTVGAMKVESSPSEAEPVSAKPSRAHMSISRRVLLLCLFALIILYGVGYVLWTWVLIPRENRQAWRCAYVVYRNVSSAPCQVKFEGKTYDVSGGGVLVVPDLFGRMPRQSQLKVVRGSETQSVKFQLAAGEDYLANPDRQEYVLLRDPGGFHSHQLPKRKLDDFVWELGFGSVPQSALEMLAELEGYVSKQVVRRSSSDCIRGFGKEFSGLGLVRSEEYTSHLGTMAAGEGLWHPVGQRIGLSDASLMILPGSKGIELRFDVTLRPLRPLGFPTRSETVREIFRTMSQEQISGRATVIVVSSGDGATLTVACHDQSQKVSDADNEFLGNWKYIAKLDSDEGTPNWCWRYVGRSQKKRRNQVLTVEVRPGGEKRRTFKNE